MDFISVILTEMKFQTGMRFSCEQNLPETKWISAESLDIVFNARVRSKLIAGMDFISVILNRNFISGDKISCKHYPKWNAYTCLSKYWPALKCSRNETSCKQNLFSRRFEISNRYDFILLLLWTFSKMKMLGSKFFSRYFAIPQKCSKSFYAIKTNVPLI